VTRSLLEGPFKKAQSLDSVRDRSSSNTSGSTTSSGQSVSLTLYSQLLTILFTKSNTVRFPLRSIIQTHSYTPFFILVSGRWEIFSRQVEFRDFSKFQWKSALVVVEKYSNITIMYLQRRRKVFLFIIFLVKLLMIHMDRDHRHITSNVSSSYRIVL
jgi:hypothetical protein